MQMCSLSSIAREYLAIRTISFLPYKDLILNAVGENSGTEAEGWKIPISLKEYVESTFNQYQREAITVSFYFRCSMKCLKLIYNRVSALLISFSNYLYNFFQNNPVFFLFIHLLAKVITFEI